MTRFRPPPRTRVGAIASVEQEFVEERASALGRAGDRLAEAIEAWRACADDPDAGEAEVDAALDDVAEAAYALIVQRECAGFRINNLTWIRRCYPVPEDALRRV